MARFLLRSRLLFGLVFHYMSINYVLEICLRGIKLLSGSPWLHVSSLPYDEVFCGTSFVMCLMKLRFGFHLRQAIHGSSFGVK